MGYLCLFHLPLHWLNAASVGIFSRFAAFLHTDSQQPERHFQVVADQELF